MTGHYCTTQRPLDGRTQGPLDARDLRTSLLLGGFALLCPVLLSPRREAFIRAVVLTILVIILMLVIKLPLAAEWPMLPDWPALPLPLVS
jgi:hypothetical protein